MSSEQFSEKPLPAEYRCPHCDASLSSATVSRCWMCRERLTPESRGKTRTNPDTTSAGSDRMTGVIVIFLCLGLLISCFLEAPGLAVLLGAALVPFVIRSSRRKITTGAADHDRPGAASEPAPLGVLAQVAGGLAIALLSIIAFGIAFTIVCTGGLVGLSVFAWSDGAGALLFVGLAVLAMIAGTAAAVFTARWGEHTLRGPKD